MEQSHPCWKSHPCGKQYDCWSVRPVPSSGRGAPTRWSVDEAEGPAPLRGPPAAPPAQELLQCEAAPGACLCCLEGRDRNLCRLERRSPVCLQIQKVSPQGLLAVGAGLGPAARRDFPMGPRDSPRAALPSALERCLPCSLPVSALGPQASSSTLATVCGTARRRPWPPSKQGLLTAIWTIASDTQPRPQRWQQP